MSPVLPFALSCSLISFTMRICAMNNPLLAPANPARFPAMLKSWHGEPPVITSTISISAPLIFAISPRCFISVPPSYQSMYSSTLRFICSEFVAVGIDFVDFCAEYSHSSHFSAFRQAAFQSFILFFPTIQPFDA